MSKPIRILVLGCGGSPAVNFIKSLRLAKQKFYIVGVDQNKYFLQIAPVEKRYLIPQKENTRDYVDKLIKIIRKEKIDFVHAQPDSDVKILSDYREELPAKTFLPSKKAVDIFQDKWDTFVKLNDHSISVPYSQQIKNEKILRGIFNDNTKVIWIRASRGAGGKASLPAKTFEEAHMWIKYWVERGLGWEDFLASEYLPGKEVSWLSLWKNGKLICSQQKERMGWVQANISPSGVGGTTAIQKTSSYDNVNDVCTKTILAVDKNANGIYVVDVKENNEGVPCVMEINPGRFFTTSLFFPTAGVNFPLILVNLALGLKIPKIEQYNVLEDDIYWVRVTDGNTGIVTKHSLKFNTV